MQWLAGVLLVAACAPGEADLGGAPDPSRLLAGPSPRLVPLDDAVAGTCEYTFDEWGAVTRHEDDVFSLTSEGLPVSMTRDGAPHSQWQWLRGDDGRILDAAVWTRGAGRATEDFEDGRVVRDSYGRTYTWDDAGRPTSAYLYDDPDHGPDYEIWAWDDAGHLTAHYYEYGSLSSPNYHYQTRFGWTWDDEGRLTGSWELPGYDDEPERTTTWTAWDDEGRPTAGETSEGHLLSYTWNADGHVDAYVDRHDLGATTTTWVRETAWEGTRTVTETRDDGFTVDEGDVWTLDGQDRVVGLVTSMAQTTWTWADDGRLADMRSTWYDGTPQAGGYQLTLSGDCPNALLSQYAPPDWGVGPYPDPGQLPDPSGAW